MKYFLEKVIKAKLNEKLEMEIELYEMKRDLEKIQKLFKNIDDSICSEILIFMREDLIDEVEKETFMKQKNIKEDEFIVLLKYMSIYPSHIND